MVEQTCVKVLAGVAVLVLSFAGHAESGSPLLEPPPAVELWTVGPGEDLYERFGHTALRVSHADGRDVLYNFGTTDFSQPNLIYSFVTGEARFWLSTERPSASLEVYREADRELWTTRLRLEPAAAWQVANELEDLAADRERSYYRYHHFFDNCTTRIRDLLDEATGGALRAALAEQSHGPSFRTMARRGFADSVLLVTGVDLLLGRAADQARSPWELCFLPEALEQAVLGPGLGPDGRPREALGYARERLQQRQGGPVADADAELVQLWFWGAGALFLLLLGLLLWLAPRPRRAEGVAVLVYALVQGAAGSAVAGFAWFSVQPEVKLNETLLWLWPSELVLVVAGVWVLGGWRRGLSWAVGYLWLHLAVHGLVLVGHVPGWLVQPQLHLVFASAAANALVLVLVRRHRGALTKASA